MESLDGKIEPGGIPGGAVLETGSGRLAVRLELRPVGRDWLLLITGGRAHLGAAAVAGPLAEPVHVARGTHKEGPLAAACAGILAGLTGAGCAVVAGIHQDRATPAEIEALVANARRGTEALACWAVSEVG